MAPLSYDHWIIVILAFVLGLVIGMYLLAGGKWKRRYRDELARREELEAENRRLHSAAAETDSLHRAALRNPVDRDRPL